MSLAGKTILVTGGAHRVGRVLSLEAAQTGATVIIHYGRSNEEAENTRLEIESAGGRAQTLQANLGLDEEVAGLIHRAREIGPLAALINNAAIFEPYNWQTTDLTAWNRHLQINLTAPFLLSQAFARHHPSGVTGRIINILDWRALRPGADHLPYTISKAALAALTKSLAIALAPDILVNGLALGAILPPSDDSDRDVVIRRVPAGRWADLAELRQTISFLLASPGYITGEIIHLDGGRHLV